MLVYELFEDVGENYLYHATSPASLMRILQSGLLKAGYRSQTATTSQTDLPTISTTRNKNYAESDVFLDFLMLPPEGNSFILVLDRNRLAYRYRILSTSQGKQMEGDEFEEVIVAPKGQIPIQGILKGFYINPKRVRDIFENNYLEYPWFKTILASPYFMNKNLLARSNSPIKINSYNKD